MISAKKASDALKRRPSDSEEDRFLCPITHESMTDPVVASDGHTYERRALKELKKTSVYGDYVFYTERKTPITAATFRKMVSRVGQESELGLSVHPHMLRHSTGFKLANDGQDTRSIQFYLGHRNIQHTVRYTEIAEIKFKNFWND